MEERVTEVEQEAIIPKKNPTFPLQWPQQWPAPLRLLNDQARKAS